MADTEDTIEKSHVYVVEGALNVCKIGKTIDIRARISALQTGHPIKLTLHLALPMPKSFARQVERETHKALHTSRQTGEWFTVSPSVAIATVKTVASRFVPDMDDDLLRASLACIDRVHTALKQMHQTRLEIDVLRREVAELERREDSLLHQVELHENRRDAALAEFKAIGGTPELWGEEGMPRSVEYKLAFLRKCMMCRPPEYRTEVDASIADDNWNYRRRWKGP